MYKDLQQGTEEWLKIRLGKFTASSANAIKTNGKGLETLALEKAVEIIIGKEAKKKFKSQSMEDGNEREDEARTVYELTTGLTVVQVGFCELNENVGASPDGLVGEDGLVELKCPEAKTFLIYMLSITTVKRIVYISMMVLDILLKHKKVQLLMIDINQ